MTDILASGGCSDACGWIAAMIAAVSYGSYGVPIKATLDIDVHPLVLQSYKTIVFFLCSWLVLALGQQAKWTPYGLLSGFLWVSGGTFGIYGIRNAGMAIAVGTWSSVMVLVNFVWGILIFREPVHSFFNTSLGFLILGAGLVGMSKYSVSTKKRGNGDRAKEVVELVEKKLVDDKSHLTSRKRELMSNDEMEETVPLTTPTGSHDLGDSDGKIAVVLVGGLVLTRREAGLACSVLNGLLAGSALLPLHYAKAQGFGGLSYILSFGTGALISNSLVWALFFAYNYYIHQRPQGGSLTTTAEAMPNWYIKELWLRGLIAGLLLSVAMFGSIQATTALGQGVGNSLVQSKIIISGLWGICWFKEIKDPEAISKWFMSAALCVASILWLSYERIAAK
jgi:glucose uptake protein GlcU